LTKGALTAVATGECVETADGDGRSIQVRDAKDHDGVTASSLLTLARDALAGACPDPVHRIAVLIGRRQTRRFAGCGRPPAHELNVALAVAVRLVIEVGSTLCGQHDVVVAA
jgi:hypothetical protein